MIKDISTYSGSVVGGDWNLAMSALWNDIKTTGGTVNFNQALTTLKSQLAMSGRPVQLHFLGDGESEIRPNAGTGVTNWVISDLMQFSMKKMNIIGDGDISPTRTTDVGAFLYLGFVLQALIEECAIGGVKVSGALLEFGNGTLAKIKDSKLSGNAGTIVKVNQAYACEIDNVDFLDYLGFQSEYHDKSTNGATWFRATTPPAGVVGANSPYIKIKNSRFDEASFVAIYVEDYPFVSIEGCRINISSGGSAKAIHLKNVKQAIIKHCHVGYNNVDKPMVKLENCGDVAIIGLGKDTNPSAPYRVEVDETSNAGLTLKGCPGISVDVV